MNKCECKECLHYDVCDWLDREYGLAKADNCHFAKDKSLLVELPCRCKDCKYLRKNFVGTYYCDNEKNGAAKRHTDLNEYCSYAELKEG